MFGLVRDKTTGKPKVDNPEDLHPIHLGMMSAQERQELGIDHVGIVIGANGFKPIQIVEGTYVVSEAVIAATSIYVFGDTPDTTQTFIIRPRCDVGAGNIIPAGNIIQETT